jgi:hypothetical protein
LLLGAVEESDAKLPPLSAGFSRFAFMDYAHISLSTLIQAFEGECLCFMKADV